MSAAMHTPRQAAIESAVKAYHAFAVKQPGSSEFYPYGILLAVEAAFASSGSELLAALERLYDHSTPTGPVGDDARAKALELIRKARGDAA